MVMTMRFFFPTEESSRGLVGFLPKEQPGKKNGGKSKARRESCDTTLLLFARIGTSQKNMNINGIDY